MKVVKLRIDAIHIGERLRGLQSDVVDMLAVSIAEIGQRVPITVRMIDGEPMLIAGEHRIEAVRKLERDTIDAVVFNDEHKAALWEIDENLKRADLTPLERAEHRTERDRLLKEKQEMAKQTGQVSSHDANKPARSHKNKGVGSGVGGGRPPGGKEERARAIGTSTESLDRDAKIAGLSKQAKTVAIKLGLDKDKKAMLFAAEHDDAELQVKALHSELARKAQKAERKAIAEAAKAPRSEEHSVPIVSKPVPVIDHHRAAAREAWNWVLEEFGDKAYAIFTRLRDFLEPVFVDEVGRSQREDGASPQQLARLN